MICSLKNISSVTLMADFTDGQEILLRPQDFVLYDDCLKIATKPTWELVNLGLLKDEDADWLYCEAVSEIHNWLLEGF